ncbi:MAG: serine hydrolase, partial [Bacteroidales bacterium]|nr:serine hydrolase [Bacteroidales bacterium]
TGVNINFAPVVDININPENPVINSRSFGENPGKVARFGISYMRGLQDNGIIATAKHFPGHGDTDTDSHYTLPVITHSYERLDSIEIRPFKELVDHGIKGVMIAHLNIPSIEPNPSMASTLSPKIVNGLLGDSLNFKGLKITDALDMKGVTNYYSQGQIEVNAILAGNDILLLPQNVKNAISAIESAVSSGTIETGAIEERCRKILNAKYECELHSFKSLETDSLYFKLNKPENVIVTRKILHDAMTLVINTDSIIPIDTQPASEKIASISIGNPEISDFQMMLSNYYQVDIFNSLPELSTKRLDELVKKLSEYELVIASFFNTNIFSHKNFGISKNGIKLAKSLANKTNVILVVGANPYSLRLFNDLSEFKSVLCAYEDSKNAQEIAAQVISGSLGCYGILPVSISDEFQAGFGLKSQNTKKIRFEIPEDVGINSEYLQKIDSIALDAIKQKAFPGCQILAAVDGKIIYNKSFGYHTYKKGHFVKSSDLYDLASLTKIAATTLAVMKISDEQRIDIDKRIVTYLPFLKNTNKESIILREMMAHQAMLKPWIPFYKFIMDESEYNTNILSEVIDPDHSIKITDNLYMHKDYQFTMMDTIINSKLLKKKKYRYSDLGFYMLKKIIENVTNSPFDKYLEASFYKPLGLQHMTFNPLTKNDSQKIVPTENDKIFRKCIIHGYVHDPGAAMLGGVSGHAGLFSNAYDMAVIMQMLLQEGYYGGHQFIEPETIKEFAKQQFPLNENRRGIGFDKPNTENPDNGPTCSLASPNSFGHTGFTGTYAWADPDYNLVYIFLSNRIHPDAANKKLVKLNIRTNIQQVLYEALEKTNNTENLSDSNY